MTLPINFYSEACFAATGDVANSCVDLAQRAIDRAGYQLDGIAAERLCELISDFLADAPVSRKG